VTTVVGICDYGVGNLRSVERAIRACGAEAVISDAAETIASCDGVILPGVGAFAVAAHSLQRTGLGEAVRSVARGGGPVLGVCLGFQLLFERSDEGAGGDGLALLRGQVSRLVPGAHLKIPHMGWNTLDTVDAESTLLAGTAPGAYMYFVHSYAATAASADVAATTHYGRAFAAAVERGNVMGTQFHPEKSGAAGLRIYANFIAACAARTLAQRVH
jgi:glutamine amidotransferase